MVLAVAFGASAKFRWGPVVGANFPYYYWEQNLVESTTLAGFSAGVQCELMIPGIGFGVSSGIFYEQRGATLNLGEKLVWASQGYGKERSYLHYIEIPIHLRFKYTRLNGMEDYVAPFVFGGPSFSILAAHSNVKALKYAGGEMGLTVGLGVEIFKNWQVQASRTWGMVYAVKTKLLDDFSAKNRTWDIRVVYLF